MFQSVGRLVSGLVDRRLVDSSEYKESRVWKKLFVGGGWGGGGGGGGEGRFFLSLPAPSEILFAD